ncbi:hypothetical protein RUM44_001032 [Polyplax serrata]|uniref:DNA-directed RNA polymerases I and III subunit RPAC1 n=1 Tax=Polyplax serrata TaxID=468196 RepID=A0ABR1B6K2_POLSC
MQDAKDKVVLKEFGVENTYETDCSGEHPTGEEEWNHQKFKKKFKVVIIKISEFNIEFDLIGISCAVANAFRRILLSEVPSMAIEKVFVLNNTSLIKDEVLAHRLGLVPLKADPKLFEFRPENSTEPNEQDTLEYELKIKCTVNRDGHKNSYQIDDLYVNHSVYSKHIKWVPIGSQAKTYKEKDVLPVHADILLNKLRPGQELDLRLHAVKGIGKDHTKFSPVATAFYRMLPEINIIKTVTGEAAERLQTCFSPGVIELRENEDGVNEAFVANARYDSGSRIVYRHDDLKDCVEMKRVRGHFIFVIESVGALPPEELFIESVKILKNKCFKYLQELDYSKQSKKKHHK